MLYKVTLNAVVIFLREDSSSQVVVTFTVAILFAGFSIQVHAFSDPDDEKLHCISVSSIAVTMFSAILLQHDAQIKQVGPEQADPYSMGAITALILITNLGMVILFILSLVISVSRKLRAEAFTHAPCQTSLYLHGAGTVQFHDTLTVPSVPPPYRALARQVSLWREHLKVHVYCMHHHCAINAPSLYEESPYRRCTITVPSPSCTVTVPSLLRHCNITAPSLYHRLRPGAVMVR